MQEAYLDFAGVYDELMDNIPYDEWFNYLHGLLQEYNITDGIIAELGCGTGSITERLSKAGYDMIGIDNSLSMLDVANSKKSCNDSSSLYLCQDMREFELYGTVSAVVSICDSVNYITDADDLLQVFKLVNNYLDPKGIFIFDFHPRHYYKNIVANSTIAEDRDNISFIWDNFYDEDEDINELYLSLFVQENEKEHLYKKYEELHLQKGYTLCDMIELIKKSGLEFICSYDAFTKNTATEECERIYIIAREQGKK